MLSARKSKHDRSLWRGSSGRAQEETSQAANLQLPLTLRFIYLIYAVARYFIGSFGLFDQWGRNNEPVYMTDEYVKNIESGCAQTVLVFCACVAKIRKSNRYNTAAMLTIPYRFSIYFYPEMWYRLVPFYLVSLCRATRWPYQ